MFIPPINILEDTAKKFVWEAKKNGNLSKFTPRSIRQALETEFALEEGTLDAPHCKKAIKTATKYAVDNDPPTFEGTDTAKPRTASGSKRKSLGVVKAKPDVDEEDAEIILKGKAKSKSKVVDDEGSNEEKTPKGRKFKSNKNVSEDKDEEKSSKKRKLGAKSKQKQSEDKTNYEVEQINTKIVKETASDEDIDFEDGDKTSPVTSASKSRTKKDTNVYKSSEHVLTSDMEQDEPMLERGPSVSKPNKPTKPENISLKSKVKIDSDSTPSKPLSSKKTTPIAAPKSVDVKMMDDAPDKSDSELSVLIDEPPKKKRKSSSGEKGSKKSAEKSKPKKATKSSAALTKDEETIKRLKSLVVACGTRKVWSKVFQDLDSPQQQIKKLKEMLTELGMTGRMSMEQAKAIKEKREFERELADVTEFAAKMETAPKRRATKKSGSLGPDDPAEEEKAGSSEDEDEEVQAPRKRAMNARKSIMAFLDDQSDDE